MTYWERVVNNFAVTNSMVKGFTLPSLVPGVGLGALTGGAMGRVIGVPTGLAWLRSGFQAIATFGRLETGLAVASVGLANFVTASMFYEGGVLAGAMLEPFVLDGMFVDPTCTKDDCKGGR